MKSILNHSYLLFAITCAVYSQCVIRWRLGLLESEIPKPFVVKLIFIFHFLLDPWVISSIVATFFAGVFWIISLTKFELNYAYPWMAMIFLIMMFMGTLLFNESLNNYKIIGTIIVCIGLVVVARG